MAPFFNGACADTIHVIRAVQLVLVQYYIVVLFLVFFCVVNLKSFEMKFERGRVSFVFHVENVLFYFVLRAENCNVKVIISF